MDDVTLRIERITFEDEADTALLEAVMQHGDMFTEKEERVIGAMYDRNNGLLTLMFDDRDQLYRVPLWFRRCVENKAAYALIDKPSMVTLHYLRKEIPNKTHGDI